MAGIEVGDTVEVFWQNRDIIRGKVIDVITFNGKSRYGVQTNDGRVHDVWPDNSVTRRVPSDG